MDIKLVFSDRLCKGREAVYKHRLFKGTRLASRKGLGTTAAIGQNVQDTALVFRGQVGFETALKKVIR